MMVVILRWSRLKTIVFTCNFAVKPTVVENNDMGWMVVFSSQDFWYHCQEESNQEESNQEALQEDTATRCI